MEIRKRNVCKNKVYSDVFKKPSEKSVLKNEGSEDKNARFWNEEIKKSVSTLSEAINLTEVNG